MSTAESLPWDAGGFRLEHPLPFNGNGSDSTSPRRGAVRVWRRDYVHLLRWTDALVIAGCLAVLHTPPLGQTASYYIASMVIATLWLGMLAVYRSREPRVLGHGLEEYRRVCLATLVLYGGIAALSTLFRLDIFRAHLLAGLPLGLAGLLLSRRLARQVMRTRRRDGESTCAVLAVGTPESAQVLTEELARYPEAGYTVVGVCGPDISEHSRMLAGGTGGKSAVPAYPFGDDVMAAVAASGADMVAVTSGHISAGKVRELSWELEKSAVDLVIAPLGMLDVSSPRLMIRPVGGLPLIHIGKPQYRGAKRLGKRLFDVCFSAAVLSLLTPVLLLVALAIKIEDRGPIFYASERIGLNGRPFRMIKFRTMVVDADQKIADVAHLNEGNGLLFKIRSDPRVTRVGTFLRRYSIDEIPQFINVLRREMSVVGPRPPLSCEVSSYDDQMRRRLLVRPGITGLWQISGRSDLSLAESMRLDLAYVENWSMVADLVIAAKTASVVCRGTGAY